MYMEWSQVLVVSSVENSFQYLNKNPFPASFLNHNSYVVQFSALLIIDHFHEILDRKSTRLNSSHVSISYAVFCLKKKNVKTYIIYTDNKCFTQKVNNF